MLAIGAGASRGAGGEPGRRPGASCELTAARAAAERAASGLRFAPPPPPGRRALGTGIAAAAALLVASIGWWFVTGASDPPAFGPVAALPARVLQDPAPASQPMPEPAGIDAAPAPRATPSERADCAVGDCAPPPSPAAPTPAAAPAAPADDPDAWALHPEPGPVNPAGGFTGMVNTPQAPGEFDTTPGEDSPAEETSATPAVTE